MKRILTTQTVSKGYAIGPAYPVIRRELVIERRTVSPEEKESEIRRFQDAAATAKKQLESIAGDSEIFEAYIQLVQDEALIQGIIKKIRDGSNAEAAVEDTANEFIMIFEMMEDAYMRERAADLKDVKKRLQYALAGIVENPFTELREPAIIIAKELTPSDTADMNFDNVLGFLTELGGVTSHVSIIAKGKGIPCLTGVKDICSLVKAGMMIAMDAGTGEICLDPDKGTIEDYTDREARFEERERVMDEESKKPSVTRDGHSFMLCANVGNIEDIKDALKSRIEGIGLFRSEFVYMMKKDAFPTEEEQFQAYRQVVQKMGGKKVIVRTLDIGADKKAEYFGIGKEENPAMGYRAVRICLKQPEILKTQLRALFRAAVYGNLSVIYPMITSVEEVQRLLGIAEEVRDELANEKIPFRYPRQGIMVETPAAVMISDELAELADFLSIGTNDLTQYTLAIDRQNEKLYEFYNPHHKAVMRMIRIVTDNAHKHGKRVGICGELGADTELTEEFLRMGIDELSVAPSMVLELRKIVREMKEY